jgi:hypothetical protein
VSTTALQSTRIGLNELDANLKRVAMVILLGVNTSTITLSEVSTYYVVEVRVEIGLLRLARGRTSRIDFSEADFSTQSKHKPLALIEVCTKHCRREYDCRNRGLIVHCTS